MCSWCMIMWGGQIFDLTQLALQLHRSLRPSESEFLGERIEALCKGGSQEFAGT